ncbi:MAG: hypothetical protein A3I05_04955 [Deltaproteobacteria bacterium RIFCSPLOWO2_02_FULL_44_10]|nr:MAG: hypothetical protein A3C46_00250 [Deltaproteobacteria bacterium RIFCSPHIGHO2_02_FULL_44_16]OGQ45155.1 MAG: hypothetical protein A3I05_04955 [Deltaproteobacteria bacterium RIFCSPLOWO2_02_FULL_44_10]
MTPLPYELLFKPSFFKDLKRLPKEIRDRLTLVFENIRRDPFAVAAKRLVGYTDLYRYRLGDYRLVYYVKRNERKIMILLIAHRKEVYRFLIKGGL